MMDSVKEVDVDPDDTFKYVLIQVKDKQERTKHIVRGYEWAQYHGT